MKKAIVILSTIFTVIHAEDEAATTGSMFENFKQKVMNHYNSLSDMHRMLLMGVVGLMVLWIIWRLVKCGKGGCGSCACGDKCTCHK